MTVRNHFIRIPFLLASMLVASALHAAQSDSSLSKTFSGEIMDSLCAKAGSHDQMMQDMKSMGREKQSCSAKCVQLGARYVLYDPAKRAVYELDNQDKAEQFAGHRVRISGTLQKKKIKIENIEPAD